MGVVEFDVELFERTDGPWRESVAAHLVAAVRRLLEHDHLGTGPCGSDRRRGAGWPAADDGDVVVLGRGGHGPILAERGGFPTVTA